MNKNRILTLCVVLTIFTGLLSGCQKQENTAAKTEDKKIQVVCTIFPQYDWVNSIIGENTENFDVTLLLDHGVDLHSYQPTAEDIVKIANADLFIYVGGESDAWVDDALKEATNPNLQAINLCEVLGENIKEEEIIEGMEAEEEEGITLGKDAEEEPEYDEHVWLSLKNAERITEKITEVLQTIAPKSSQIYKENSKIYLQQLKDLDAEYQQTVDTAKRSTLLFGDRFPFRYLVDDYGLNYHAAFVGCSAETEASFETIAYLSGKTDELGLPGVLVLENSDQKIAKAIIDNTTEKNQKVLVMNSLQSVTGEDVKNGVSYLSVMKENLEVLKQALN